MDTKSKKFKAIRIVCFLLCLILVGTSGFALSRAARFAGLAGYIYSTDNIRETVNEPLLSKAALDEIGFAYYAMRRVHITYEDGKVFENGKLEKLMEQYAAKSAAKQVEDEIAELEKKLKVFNELLDYLENNEHERDDYFEDGSAYYSGKYDQSIVVRDVTENPFFTLLEDGSYAVDREAVAEYYDYRKQSYSLDVTDYRNEYDFLKDYLSLYSSIKYMIINEKTGEIFTNSPHATAAEFVEAYEKETWMVSSDNNFDTVAVNSKFIEYSEMTGAYSAITGDRAKNFDGKLIKNTTYLSQFFNSIRYGWQDGYNKSSYVLGCIDFLNPAKSTVYISFDKTTLSTADPMYTVYTEYREAANIIYLIAVIGIISAALALALTVLLIILNAKGNIKLGWQSKIPGEIHAILCLGGAAAAGVCVVAMLKYIVEDYRQYITYGFAITLCAVCATACYALLMNWLITVIKSIKGKVYFKRLIVAQPYKLIKKIAVKLKANSSDRKNGVRRQLAIFLAVYLGISFLLWLLMCVNSGEGAALLALIMLVLLNVGLVLVLYFYAKALDKISDTVKKTQHGDFEADFSGENMPKIMVELTEDIAQMRSGMKIAVDSAVREQKAKMDLITNVSHDLKTPLTSIITYSDLIKRSGIADEEVDGYADILIEKSFRLKQLIEDLTEATRVSTGAVELQKTQVNLYELVAQALGENEAPLAEKNIDVRFGEPEINPMVFADGQKTYRILENIISNIGKYAMPGTRAYVEVSEKDGMGAVTFKNISNDPLNIPAEQLMDRFVRGDASRSGEGSGLGLSIARDLCELQGGKFNIQIDGDMFTATVMLPMA